MIYRVVALTLLLQAISGVLLAAEIPILGRVLGPDGEPRSKVEVMVEPILSTYERARLRHRGELGPDGVAQTRTGADGTFEIPAPAAGMWNVVVSARGMLVMEFRLVPLVAAAELPTLELRPANDLEVRVVDHRGKPRPAAVGALSLGARSNAWRPRLRLTTAGKDGIAHLPLGREEKIQLEVLAAGCPLQTVELEDETSTTVKVAPGVVGSVRILGRQKKLFAEALAVQGSGLLPLGMSDSEGGLALALRKKEPRSVQVLTAEGWHGSFDLELAADDKVRDLHLDPPMNVQGQVLDLSDRDPISDALVWSVRGEFTVTDRQGGYELAVDVTKSRSLSAAAAGYLADDFAIKGDDGDAALPMALTPAAAVSGKVVDPEGHLLDGVVMTVRSLSSLGRGSSAAQRAADVGWNGRSSRRGRFRVTGLPTGVAYQLVFEAPGFGPQQLDVEPLRPFESRTGLEVVMQPGRLAFGLVVDEDDVPIAGAEVSLVAPPPTDDFMAVMRMRRYRSQNTDDPQVTDTEGRFEIPDLAGGTYDLAVTAPGFAPAQVPGVRVVDEGRVDLGTVVMVPGATLDGRVVDDDGAGLEGAEITVDSGGWGARGRRSDAEPQATTDVEGNFAIPDLLPGQPISLTVRKQGYAPESVIDVKPSGDEPLVITLLLTGRLEGRVVNQQGEPIEGAAITTSPDFRAMPRQAIRSRLSGGANTQSDVDGRFLIADLGPGMIVVAARGKGYQQQTREGLEITAGGKLELELVLELGAIVEGTVTTEDGEPVVQAGISIAKPTSRRVGYRGSSINRTDAEGRYRVEGAPIGVATITARRENGQRMAKSVGIKPGSNVVDLVFERGFEVSGQVVDPDGDPIGGAAIVIRDGATTRLSHFNFGRSQAVSDPGGSFVVPDVRAGKYRVAASIQGFAPVVSESFEVAGDVTGLLLRLTRGAKLQGDILGLEFDELGALELMAYSPQGGMRVGRADFTGEYAFESLAAGEWTVFAQVGSGRAASIKVEIQEGVAEVVKDIEFTTGFTLTGVVLDQGQPLAGASVSATAMASSFGQGVTGSDGRFRLDDIKAGSHRITVTIGSGYRQVETLEVNGDQDLTIEIVSGSIRGVVRNAVDGEPIVGAQVDLESLDPAVDGGILQRFGIDNQVSTDSDGAFQAARVHQGSWRVVATKSDFAPDEATVAVGEGRVEHVELRLAPTEGVSFEVVLQSGATVPSAQIATRTPSGQLLTDGSYPIVEGRVHVSTLPPGSWELVIQAGDSAATRFAVQAPGDQGRVVLPTGGTLYLEVPELKQQPTARIELTGRPFASADGSGSTPGEWTLFAGRALIRALTPGNWSFVVIHDDRTWSGSAVVNPGATTEVSLP